MSERKLASIRRVHEISPIEGADRIVLAKIDGWQVITQKTNYQPGDFCVYFEIDSFLPVEERYEFLRKSGFKTTKNLGDGFRIKTMKMRGELSQGLSLPLDAFPEYFSKDGSTWVWKQHDSNTGITCDVWMPVEEDTDITDLLKIQKYEKPIPSQLTGRVHGNFPIFIRKTDQERVQNYRRKIEEHADERFEITLKLDGSSLTAYKKDDHIGVCTRNWEVKEEDENGTINTFWKAARNAKIIELLEGFNKNVAIQGELMGPGVQHNRETLDDHYVYIFDIWDIDNQRYLRPDERQTFISQIPDLKHCPILYKDVKLSNFFFTDNHVNDLLKLAEGASINHAIREGIVFKSLDSDFTFKAINNEFLLKEKD